jgi:polar amino acid transport system substrate-binding protein
MRLQARTVRLVADPYPPYQFEEKGRVRGIDQDTIGEALRARGLRAGTTLLPWSQCLQWMQEGKADGIFQIAPNLEREKRFLFSAQLRVERTVLLQSRAGSLAVRDPARLEEELRGQTLGVLSGYSYGAGIEALPASLKVELASQEPLLKALAEGRVDAILMDQGVADYLARKLGLQPMERIEGYELRRSLHVAFQRGEEELVRLFNAGLEEIQKGRRALRIFQRYGVRP